MLDFRCWMLDLTISIKMQHSTSNIQHPTPNIQIPAFNIQHPSVALSLRDSQRREINKQGDNNYDDYN